jgi:hypothetical protein
MVEIRSRPLWQDLDGAAADAEEVLSVLTQGEHPDVQVSRVDVTADWQGWEPERELLELFTCRARQDASWRAHRRHTGWSWGGGGAVYARCYDKSTEIRGTDKAEWFPKVWARSESYEPGGKVWRLEYQVKREAIREFTELGLEPGAFKSWAGMREHLGSIFHTLGRGWCSLRLPRTAKDRQRIDPRWEAILTGSSAWAGCVAPVDLARVQAETEFKRTLDQLAGYVARGIAERWALRGKDDDVSATYDRLFADVCTHLARKGDSLEGKARALFEPLRVKAQAAEARRLERARARAEGDRVRL